MTAGPFSSTLTEPGAFVVGCNYWASHAGTAMWRDWREEVVERDLARLASAGLQVLRVFPLWPDFQPITELAGVNGKPVEMRHGEDPCLRRRGAAPGCRRPPSGDSGCSRTRLRGTG